MGYDFAMVCAGEIMATTLEQIASFLDNRGWFYEVDKEAQSILTRVQAENVENFIIAIRLHEDGRFFEMFAPRILCNIQNHRYMEARKRRGMYPS